MNLDFRRLAALLYPAVFIACVLAYFCACVPAHGSDSAKSATKAYSPFDEPKPRTPKEFQTDKRLDQRVKVFCKSRNLRDLFANLSAKTEVKITATREIHGERAIIYFHDRPLRDVMTEISNLFGYYWMVSGKEGSYSYELFEDTRHAKRRSELVKAQRDELDRLAADFSTKMMDAATRDDFLSRLRDTNPQAYNSVRAAYDPSFAKFFAAIPAHVLQGAPLDRRGQYNMTELPPSLQGLLADWTTSMKQRFGDTKTYSVGDLTNTAVGIRRKYLGPDGVPSFDIEIRDGSGSWNTIWPSPGLTQNDLRSVAGWPKPEPVADDVELPKEPKITADKLRVLISGQGLLIGDALQAIAEQSGKDVIADDRLAYMWLGAVKEMPFDQFVQNICGKLGYTCQVADKTLRFRYNDWYAHSPLKEPPAELISRLWESILRDGRVGVWDVLDVAALPDDQLNWRGFKFMDGGSLSSGFDTARRWNAALRFWRSLDAGELSAARSSEGLPVSQLTQAQVSAVLAFPEVTAKQLTADDLAQCHLFEEEKTVKSKHSSPDRGEWEDELTYGELSLMKGDTRIGMWHVYLSDPLDTAMRTKLAAQRKADAEADVIEIVR